MIRVGYPCINRSIGCTANSTFRLASYSEERLKETLQRNLDCLGCILEYNRERGFLFFRISSDLVPFASHPVCQFDWVRHFRPQFKRLGAFIRQHDMRISMHPDQFVLLNAPNPDIVAKSIRDLEYHCKVLDAMGLDRSAKVQIHVGGAYGDKPSALNRFVMTFRKLPLCIRRRLAVENDERLFSLSDCLELHRRIKVPIILDAFHHALLNCGEPLDQAMAQAAQTWTQTDGPLMLDYSHQEKGRRVGTHAETLEPRGFRAFLKDVAGHDFDLMLEIKDKEKSAEKALRILRERE